MKNKILALLIAALTITASAATLSACDLIGGDNGGSVNPPAGDVGGNTDKDNTGDADKDPDNDPDHTHTFDQEVAEAKYLKSRADCTHKAVYYFSCACGEAGEETFEYGKANGHREVTDKAVEPTCTTAGKTAGKHCSVCREVLVAQEVIKAKGHTEVEDKAVEPTCYKSGKTAGSHCSVCGEKTKLQYVVPKLERHEFSGDVCELCGYHTPTEGLHYIINDDRETCSVAGIGEAVGTVIYIADEFEGKPVTGIDNGAFAHNKNLTEVHIPKSVTDIEGQAFYNCSGLTEITIPESVTNIGWQPFMDCSGLESITVEEGNENYKSENNCILTKEGRTLVLGCKNSVIPEGVTNIGLGAFAGCTGLTSIVLPESVTYIDGNAFNECVNLESIVIPEGVTFIGGSVFCNCRSLTSIVIPGKVTSIGDMTFMGCEKLTIKCVAEEKPAGWRDSWNYSDCAVIWGYKGED